MLNLFYTISSLILVLGSIYPASSLLDCSESALPTSLIYVKNLTMTVRITFVVKLIKSQNGTEPKIGDKNCSNAVLLSDSQAPHRIHMPARRNCSPPIRFWGDCSLGVTYADGRHREADGSPQLGKEHIQIWLNARSEVPRLLEWKCDEFNKTESIEVDLLKAVICTIASNETNAEIHLETYSTHQAKYPAYYYILIFITIFVIFLAIVCGNALMDKEKDLPSGALPTRIMVRPAEVHLN